MKRPLPLCTALTSVLAVLALADAQAACPPLSLSGFSPSTAPAGGTVTLSGNGFCGTAQNYLAWGFDGSYGFPFLTSGVSQGSIQAQVGSVTTPVTGSLVLWEGRRVAIPDAVFELEDGIYHLHDAYYFLPVEEAVNGTFAATLGTGSGIAYGSELLSGALVIDFSQGVSSPATAGGGSSGDALTGTFAPALVKEQDHSIQVMVAIRTNGPPNGGDGGDGGDGDPPPHSAPPGRWALYFQLDCYGKLPACTGSLAGTLGTVLGRQTGDLGMAATANGSSLTLSHASNSISAGFVNVEIQ